MTRTEAGERLRTRRSRLSHDLLKNQFGACLVPGWDCRGADRLDEARDIVLRALRGDADAVAEVRAAVDIWTRVLYPELSAFLDSVESELGFIASDTFRARKREVLVADGVIRGIVSRGADDPMETARDFWRSCDEVAGFLEDLGLHSEAYLLGWGPETTQRDSGL